MRLRSRILITALALATLGAFAASGSAMAAPIKLNTQGKKHNRKVISAEGKISGLKNGRDRKHKRYWEYRLRTASGQTVIVHDYQYGRYRQPAGMGIKEGAKRKVRGFYVHISTVFGSSKKEPVLIVSPAN